MQVIYRPTSDGAYTPSIEPQGASPYYACVDEEVADDHSTYIVATNTIHFTFGFDNPTERGKINFVRVYVRCAKAAAGDGGFGVSVYHPSHGRLDGPSYAPGFSYETQYMELSTNPWTEADWTWDELNNLEIGGYMGIYPPSSSMRTTQVYIVIDYTPIAAGQVRIIGMMM